jgi:histidinol dehydrogenase
MTTPCGPDGTIVDAVLVAASEAGVTEIYRIGGAQAVAALAYGTKTVRRVDKITGPGNAYVAAAKRMVFGEVGIDSIAGPTEVVIVADRTARPEFVAADLIAQAEHDEQAMSVCIATSAGLLRKVGDEVDRQLADAPRRAIAGQSLGQHGLLLLVKSMDQAVAAVNRIAPEHVELMTKQPSALARRITAAGAIFVGEWATEALGDYVAGPNHTLPTSGTARFASALSVADFVRFTTVLECSRSRFRGLASAVETLAEAEGLFGHAASVKVRRTAHV